MYRLCCTHHFIQIILNPEISSDNTAYICKTNEIKRGQGQIHLGLLDFFESSCISNGSICTSNKVGAELANSLQEADKINQLEMIGIPGVEKLRNVKRQPQKLEVVLVD